MDSTSPDAAAEKVYQIHGTGISFSSNPERLDKKATEALREIRQQGFDGLEVYANAFGMDPQDLPKGFFLSSGTSFWKNCWSDVQGNNNMWIPHGSAFGYGIVHRASGYKGFRMSLAYRKDNRKTNSIMVVYNLIDENLYIKSDGVVLCHVFQSDNYDPRPKRFPDFFDFDQTSLNSRVEELEGLMDNPKAFKDLDEFNGAYNTFDNRFQASRRNAQRADVWNHFTKIKVLGPDGRVMLTLAICHHCSMAYLTGKWDSQKGSLSNNGTKTLKEHHRKCSAQHHIAGNPQ